MKVITLEQAKLLNEIGIDPNTADLWYYESTFGHVASYTAIEWDKHSTAHLSLVRIDPSAEVAIVKRKETPCCSTASATD